MTNVPEKAHAVLGASNAERWMNCPGSVRLTKDIPDRSTVYAEEGTAAHALMELALTNKRDPGDWLGETLNGFEVTDEMVAAIRVYLGVVDGIMQADPDARLWVEQAFSLAALNPPGEMFGTADTVIYLPSLRKLYVIDLKYGQGYAVEVENNAQLQYYGIGALEALSQELGSSDVDTVELIIVQPRAGHTDGPVRRWEVDYLDLLVFAGDLLSDAEKTLEPDAPLVPGRWCRFCKAGAICPARYEQSVAVAQVDFQKIETQGPPAPATLTTPQLVHVLNNMDILEDWCRTVRQYAQHALESGTAGPELQAAFKLVAKRATRKWKSETAAAELLVEMGLTHDEIFDSYLKSPAQAEKLLSKEDRETLNNRVVQKQSSGYVLAPSADPRPEIAVGPGAAFAALPPGNG